MLCGVATLVAGKRIRALGGTAEFVSDARAPMALVVSLPWQADLSGDCRPQLPQQEQSGLSVLVAEDSDESFVLNRNFAAKAKRSGARGMGWKRSK